MNRYDTIGRRFLALVIDGLIILPVGGFFLLIDSLDLSFSQRFILNVLVSFIGIAYNVLLHWRFGQTLGKMIAKVRVVDISNNPITLRQAFLRDIVHIATQTLQFVVIVYLVLTGNLWTNDPFTSVQEVFLVPFLVWLLIDTIVCLKNPKHRALHDLIAGTVVVCSDLPPQDDDPMSSPPNPSSYDFSVEK